MEHCLHHGDIVIRVNVDLERCEGHGRCYRTAPNVFAPIDDHGHAAFIGGALDVPDSPDVKSAEIAVQNCPEAALSWVHGGVDQTNMNGPPSDG
jgi:ferredoxin